MERERWLLIEAAQTAVQLGPQVRRLYQRLKHQRNSGAAKVAVARGLAVRLFWMPRPRHNYAQLVHMSGSRSSAVVPPPAGSTVEFGAGPPRCFAQAHRKKSSVGEEKPRTYQTGPRYSVAPLEKPQSLP